MPRERPREQASGPSQRQLRAGELEQLDLAHAIDKAVVTTDAGKRAKDLLSRELSARKSPQ